jgi:MFS family permease
LKAGEPMAGTRREHTLGIWALTLGYFLSYIPYSGFSKAITSGLLTGGRLIPGPELLPSSLVATAITILLFITVMGWWRYGRRRRVLGVNVLFPRRQTLISGFSFAVIIITTTLAYSFSGISIVLALVLMRAGVLTMSPLIDRIFHRRVRWFSWAGLVLSMIALGLSFTSVRGYQLSLAALLNLVAYLGGYALRLPCMTQIAKTGEKEVAYAYFVEEQAVAMPTLVVVPAVFALIGRGEMMNHFRSGFIHLSSSPFAPFGWAVGFFYAALGIFLSFIYLDRRENTFCMPLFSCSSLLSGIVASYVLMWWAHGPAPNGVQIGAAILIIAALLVMSPLHHLPLYTKQLKDAIAERRLVLVDFVKTTSPNLRAVSPSSSSSLITVNLQAVRRVFNRGPQARD